MNYHIGRRCFCVHYFLNKIKCVLKIHTLPRCRLFTGKLATSQRKKAVSQYGRPPVWLVSIQRLYLCLISNTFTCLVNAKPVKNGYSQAVKWPIHCYEICQNDIRAIVKSPGKVSMLALYYNNISNQESFLRGPKIRPKHFHHNFRICITPTFTDKEFFSFGNGV